MKITIESDLPGESGETIVFQGVIRFAIVGTEAATTPDGGVFLIDNKMAVRDFSHRMTDDDFTLIEKLLGLVERIRSMYGRNTTH